MKNKIIRVLSFFICFLFLATVSVVPVFAESEGVIATDVEPRWTELSTFLCSLVKHNGVFSNANVYSSASTYSAYSKLEMTLTIQEWNGSSYVDTSRSWAASGTAAVNIDKNINLPSGTYRAKSVVVVYSSSGQYIETITRYSYDLVI